jgi:hypothetical protein
MRKLFKEVDLPASVWALWLAIALSLIAIITAYGCASTGGDCTAEPIPCHEGPMIVEEVSDD